MEYWNSGAELYHYGVKGQKWGDRRYQNEDGSYTDEGRRHYGIGERRRANPNYSAEQRARDKRVYGRGGVRRINRHMNEGDGVAAARSREAERINSTRRVAKAGGNIGAIAGGIGGYLAAKKYTDQIVNKLGLPVNDPTINMLISGGIAAAGGAIGRIGGRSAVMMGAGYDPRKFRYV